MQAEALNSHSSEILLCALNSTYQHAAFGLRYMYANMGDLQKRTQIREWTIKENPRQIVEEILAHNPKIVGFGVYIWNTDEVYQCLSILKSVSPETIVVLGGPEISYETELQPHFAKADFVITGEADFSFRDFCLNIYSGIQPEQKIIRSILPEIKDIKTPYHLYDANDIQNRIIYVEASRGCPYKCEYCLSSLDKSVRNFDLEYFLKSMQDLLDRGARTFKFVDRTFNLSPSISTQILRFFLDRAEMNLFLHFEMVPDRLPQEIKDLIAQFPEGSLQFEVGLQTLNPVVAQSVSRKNDLTKVKDNFEYLRTQTKVHTHADLIVGLPGETLESFGLGFDQLASFGPDEIQVGILKRLKGTPITKAQKEADFGLTYQNFPPYQILKTSTMSYSELQLMNKYAKFWDLYANSGEFKNFMKIIKSQEGSYFWNFMKLVNFLSETYKETHSISLLSLTEQAWKFLQSDLLPNPFTAEAASEVILNDYSFGYKRRDIPPFLKKMEMSQNMVQNKSSSLKERQMRHLNKN